MNRCRRILRLGDDRGTAAVELAIVLPILIVLTLGIVEFARAYNAKISLQHAVREGVRVHALGSADPVATTKNAATSLDPNLITVSTTACTTGAPTSVTATYPFTYDIPLFGTASQTLSAEGVMRCNG